MNKQNLLGDHSIMDPPDPMPNSVVKRNSADGSVGSPHVRVGHRQASNLKKSPLATTGFYFAPIDCNVSGVNRRFLLFNRMIKKMKILSWLDIRKAYYTRPDLLKRLTPRYWKSTFFNNLTMQSVWALVKKLSRKIYQWTEWPIQSNVSYFGTVNSSSRY